MKLSFFAVLCLVIGFFSEVLPTNWITNADEITEEWLINTGVETGYTEHVRHFKRIFNKMRIKSFLEFGVGFSTKYFMDHCENVTSVEFVTPGSGPEWLKYCIDLYRNCNNWKPIAYFTGPGLDTSWAPFKYIGLNSVHQAAAYQPVYRKSYALIDPTFLDDLNNFVQQQIEDNEIDLAFVDSGICIRGDLVQVLFNKVPIIAAHDVVPKEIRHLNDVYGYNRIIVPENYLEIYVPFGMGTAFWIKNEDKYRVIINDLQNYVGREEKAQI